MRFTICVLILVLINCHSEDRSSGEKQGKLGTQGPSTATAPEPDRTEQQTPINDFPGVLMQLQPGDMTSQAGDTPIKIRLVSSDGQPVSQAVIDSIIAKTSLSEWPASKDVVFETSVDSTNSGYGPGGGKLLASAEITIRPKAELNRDSWYAVVVRNLDRKLVAASERSHFFKPNGDVVARFVKSSKPTLAAVRVCPKNGLDTVYVDFSERIAAGATQTGRVNLKRASSACDAITSDATQDTAEAFVYRCKRADGQQSIADFSVAMANAVGGSQRGVGTLASVGEAFSGEVPFAADSFVSTGDGCQISRVR